MRRTLFLVLLAVGVLAAACGPTGGTINIYNDPYHKLIIRDVLPFSTARTDATPARRVRVKNVGEETLQVRSVRIVGSSAFRLVSGQATSFGLGPGQETTISVEFRPSAITTTAKGIRHTASLFVDSSDGAQPTDEVFLRGWQAAEYENNKEPSRSEITGTIGYTTDLGTGLPKDDVLAGEEVRTAGYFLRVDSGRPVELFPLARYSSRTIGTTGRTDWYPFGNPADLRKLHDFAGCGCTDPTIGSGGENQKLVPSPTGTTSFGPSSAFGISLYASGERMYGDDGLNGTLEGHNFRFWPAEDRTGQRLANTWIVGNDLGLPGTTNVSKNWDYQDFMWVLSNARPA